LDTDYLLDLSPDIEPALARLPQSIRECAAYRMVDRDPWYEFNLSRWRAPHVAPPWAEQCSDYWQDSR
jgi:hypothetical protein